SRRAALGDTADPLTVGICDASATDKLSEVGHMGIKLNVIEHNLHQVQVDAEQMLFHIPTSSLFAQDELTSSILGALRAGADSREHVQSGLAGRFAVADIDEALQDLRALRIVGDGSPLCSDVFPGGVTKAALNTVVLNVNTGCNLSCTYCYKE